MAVRTERVLDTERASHAGQELVVVEGDNQAGQAKDKAEHLCSIVVVVAGAEYSPQHGVGMDKREEAAFERMEGDIVAGGVVFAASLVAGNIAQVGLWGN